ncbi:MAG: hypothetical protein K2O32_13050 [Acetatifactor sp.]|nr:hypothetical protein [Acetatifactor sp.]
MYFEYDAYKTFCFGAPAFGVVAFSIGIFYCGAWLVYVLLRKQWDWRKYGFQVLWIMGAGVLVCMLIGVLLNGGIYLRDEKETDAVEIQGEISNIRGLGSFSFPVVKGDYEHDKVNGYEFIIDGVHCKAVRKGSLEVGDYVTVKYLPKSGYVLYIAKTDKASANIE